MSAAVWGSSAKSMSETLMANVSVRKGWVGDLWKPALLTRPGGQDARARSIRPRAFNRLLVRPEWCCHCANQFVCGVGGGNASDLSVVICRRDLNDVCTYQVEVGEPAKDLE